MRTSAENLTAFVAFYFVGAIWLSSVKDMPLGEGMIINFRSAIFFKFGLLSPETTNQKLFVIGYTLVAVFLLGKIAKDLITGWIAHCHEEAFGKEGLLIREKESQKLKEFGVLLAFICTIVTIVAHVEQWTLFEAFYWIFCDIFLQLHGSTEEPTPQTGFTKAFSVVYQLIAIYLISRLMSNFASIDEEERLLKLRTKKQLLNQVLSLELLKCLDKDSSGHVDSGEFLAHVFAELKLMPLEDSKVWLDRFNVLDRNKDGRLTRGDTVKDLRSNEAVKPQHALLPSANNDSQGSIL